MDKYIKVNMVICVKKEELINKDYGESGLFYFLNQCIQESRPEYGIELLTMNSKEILKEDIDNDVNIRIS